MQLRRVQPVIILLAAVLLFSASAKARQGYKRIVSLNGTITGA